jgi:hypothetical protein
MLLLKLHKEEVYYLGCLLTIIWDTNNGKCEEGAYDRHGGNKRYIKILSERPEGKLLL